MKVMDVELPPVEDQICVTFISSLSLNGMWDKLEGMTPVYVN